MMVVVGVDCSISAEDGVEVFVKTQEGVDRVRRARGPEWHAAAAPPSKDRSLDTTRLYACPSPWRICKRPTSLRAYYLAIVVPMASPLERELR